MTLTQDFESYKKAQYQEALSIAWEQLSKLNPIEASTRARIEYDTKRNRFKLSFINQVFEIDSDKRLVTYSDNNKPAETFVTVVLLHYLINAKDVPFSSELISFRELYGGDVYYDAFAKRTLKPLSQNFGSNLELFKEAGLATGGKTADFGDTSIEIKVLPRIPITFVLWRGDNEVPSSSTILFDSSIKEHLHTEDIAVICSIVVSKLVSHAKAQSQIR